MTEAKHPIAKINGKKSELAAEKTDVVITYAPSMPPAPRIWISARRFALRELEPGTPVIVQRGDGSLIETTIAVAPREIGGQPVVECVGVSGPYHLRLVYVLRKETTP